MKLSAILVSVNIVATVPVAAQAAEEAVSDKAEWLKQNLAAIDKTGKAASSKISLSDPGVSARAKGTKLRPFMANRKLPSKRDVDMQLSAQQARFDERKLATQTMIDQQNTPSFRADLDIQHAARSQPVRPDSRQFVGAERARHEKGSQRCSAKHPRTDSIFARTGRCLACARLGYSSHSGAALISKRAVNGYAGNVQAAKRI